MRTAIFVFITGIVAFFAAGLDAHSAELKSVRFGPEPAKTRIVFDIAGAPDYTLSGDETGNGRLFVDFKKISIPSSALAVQPAAGHGLTRPSFRSPLGASAIWAAAFVA